MGWWIVWMLNTLKWRYRASKNSTFHVLCKRYNKSSSSLSSHRVHCFSLFLYHGSRLLLLFLHLFLFLFLLIIIPLLVHDQLMIKFNLVRSALSLSLSLSLSISRFLYFWSRHGQKNRGVDTKPNKRKFALFTLGANLAPNVFRGN